MKICILSMQKIKNHGSVLQSYALKKCLEDFGHEVFFIDIESRKEDHILLDGFNEDYSFETNPSGKSLLKKINKLDKYFINRIANKIIAKQQNTKFDDFCNEELFLDISNNEKLYDICVIGSDEVFNCNAISSWGFTSQLFGNVKNAKEVITYAASCGSTTIDHVPPAVVNKIEASFQKVKAVSVRDQNTFEFVKKISGIGPQMHFDPVLIYDFRDEMRSVSKFKLPSEKYCIVYSYYNRIKEQLEMTAIQQFCKNHSLKIISLGAPQFWIGNYISCSPFECLRLFQHASFVITDTFHGTIFSAKYAKKFGVITRDSNQNKLCDLIERLGIQQHLMNDITKIESVFEIDKDQNSINRIIDKERIRTIAYLKENTNGEKSK